MSAIPQTTEWQRIGNQIDAAFIFARADFVKVLNDHGPHAITFTVYVDIIEAAF
jgi:hypothetical protein